MLPTIADMLVDKPHDNKTIDPNKVQEFTANAEKQVQLSGPLGSVMTAALKSLYKKPPADDWRVVVNAMQTKEGVAATVALETILLNGVIAAQAVAHHELSKASELKSDDITGFAVSLPQLNADPVGVNEAISQDVSIKGSDGYTVVIDGVDTAKTVPASVSHTCSCCEAMGVRVVINPRIELISKSSSTGVS